MARPILRLALAVTLAAGEAAAGPAVFRALDVAKTGRPFYDRIQPLVGDEAVPLVSWGNPYRSYPMLQLRRHTDHVVTEPVLLRLRIVDGQPTGQDRILLLRRP